MMKLKNKVSNYEVIDDFIPDYTNDHIFKVLSGRSFPWYISEKVVDDGDEYWNSQYYHMLYSCLLYTSPSPRDRQKSRMPSSA